MVAEIKHDAFGRFSLVREIIPIRVRMPATGVTNQTCTWCGGLSYKGAGRYGNCARLFRYGTERDDRPGCFDWQPKLFCSVGCMRIYHG